MTHNLNSTVFVYRHRETGAIRALYTEDARAMTGRDDYEHVASLEPRMWIEHHFDDAAKERQPLSGGNWTPARPGAMNYLACKSRGIA